MSKTGIRTKKSRSMMFSLYSLSSVAVLLIMSFVGTLWFQTLALLKTFDWVLLGSVLKSTLWVHSLAMLIALTMASSLTYLAAIWSNTRWYPYFSSCIAMIEGAPLLIFGLALFCLLGKTTTALALTFAMIGSTQLTRRWVGVVKKVKRIEIESMQSVGMGLLNIVYSLYVRRFFPVFLSHLISVFCNLFVLVTPVLCFVEVQPDRQSLLALQLLVSVMDSSSLAASLAMVLLLIHGLRVYLDQKTAYWEVEYG